MRSTEGPDTSGPLFFVSAILGEGDLRLAARQVVTVLLAPEAVQSTMQYDAMT